MTGDVREPAVWVAPQPPDGDQARALSEWGLAHSLVLAQPSDQTPAPLPVDLTAGEAVEDLLDRAHDAISGQELAAAERALAAADDILSANPALPQAAWLRAEVDRSRSVLLRRAPGPDLQGADDAWTEAEALDGGRVSGVGEESGALHPRGTTLTLIPAAPAHARTWVDGRPVDVPRLTLGVGRHAIVRTWNDTPISAVWIDLPTGELTYAPKSSAPSCSDMDLRQARIVESGVDATGVQCPRWIATTEGLMVGSVRVATCTGARCEPLLDWRVAFPSMDRTSQRERSHRGWPAWAVWGLAGTGAAVVAGVAAAVVATGVFAAAPSQTRWVSGPLKSP